MTGPGEYVALLDWRRRVATLYGEVRARAPDDPADAHRVWRAGRDDLFRHHPQSPVPERLRGSYQGVPCFEYDPRYAFTASIRGLRETPCEIETSGGQVTRFVRVGAVDLPIGTLEIMWLEAYGGGLFLAFADATSGRATYGGGRYLLDTVKGADLGTRGDELVLDFNFAYHPSCAHDAKWTCPLAPSSNRLSVAIEAGERL
jgi:uncharacterized protein (DUF1684 family)